MDEGVFEGRLANTDGFDLAGRMKMNGGPGAIPVVMLPAASRRGDAALKEIELPAGQGDGWRVEEEFVRAIRREQPVTRTTFEDGLRRTIEWYREHQR